MPNGRYSILIFAATKYSAVAAGRTRSVIRQSMQRGGLRLPLDPRVKA